MKCPNLRTSMLYQPLSEPKKAQAPTSGSTTVGSATVSITSSSVQCIQVLLQAQEGGTHPFQHKCHLF
jgi:hypothetical protein